MVNVKKYSIQKKIPLSRPELADFFRRRAAASALSLEELLAEVSSDWSTGYTGEVYGLSCTITPRSEPLSEARLNGTNLWREFLCYGSQASLTLPPPGDEKGRKLSLPFSAFLLGIAREAFL